MSNSITSARNDKVPKQQQEEQPDALVVDITKLLNDRFPIPTEPVQASTTEEVGKKRPSIFCYLGLSVRGYEYNKRGDNRLSEMWEYVAFMTTWLSFNIDSYHKYIKENEHVALGYYMENDKKFLSSQSSTFVEFLMVSSCFVCFAILLFQKVHDGTEILKGSCREENSDLVKWRIKQFSYLSRRMMQNQVRTKLDMLRINNQFPWLAVEAVFVNSDLSKLCNTPIDRLAISCFDDLYPRANKTKVQGDTYPPGGFKHLLHIFHWTRTPHRKILVEPKPEHVQAVKSYADFYIPSATDLEGSATKFKKTAGGCDVVYRNKGLSGQMQITTLHIASYSRKLFIDLLEFEQKYMECGLPITAYIACMESLLQTKADVKLLQKNGIVKDTLKDEKEVLNFVNDLKKTLAEELNACIPNDLNILSKKVIKHHERRISRGYYQLKSQYCPNKWVIISVIAAFLLFALTAIQTVYSAMGYYKT